MDLGRHDEVNRCKHFCVANTNRSWPATLWEFIIITLLSLTSVPKLSHHNEVCFMQMSLRQIKNIVLRMAHCRIYWKNRWSWLMIWMDGWESWGTGSSRMLLLRSVDPRRRHDQCRILLLVINVILPPTLLNTYLYALKIQHSSPFEIYGKNPNRQQDFLVCPMIIMDEMDGLKKTNNRGV